MRLDDGGDGLLTLVVLLHAYDRNAANLASVENVIRRAWPNAYIYTPELPVSLFSMVNPNSIVSTLLADIDALYVEAEKTGAPYKNIVFVGHSLGALLARKLYVVACGEICAAPLEPEFKQNFKHSSAPIPARHWADKVSRIILLAGMNRGWKISPHLSLSRALFWGLGSLLGFIMYFLTRRW